VANVVYTLRRLRRRPALDRVLTWLANRFTTRRVDEFTRFTRSAGSRRPTAVSAALPPHAQPIRPPAAASIAPASFELRFVELQRQGGYEAMWDLLAEDAQRSWGDRRTFVERMQRETDEFQLLGVSVDEVSIVPEWTDGRSRRTYQHVAQLAVRYHLRLGWQEVAMDRQVHLIPAAGGWRTLYYPQLENPDQVSMHTI
jgi:hypothetical protein